LWCLKLFVLNITYLPPRPIYFLVYVDGAVMRSTLTHLPPRSVFLVFIDGAVMRSTLTHLPPRSVFLVYVDRGATSWCWGGRHACDKFYNDKLTWHTIRQIQLPYYTTYYYSISATKCHFVYPYCTTKILDLLYLWMLYSGMCCTALQNGWTFTLPIK
jgi:hypothetical protein